MIKTIMSDFDWDDGYYSTCECPKTQLFCDCQEIYEAASEDAYAYAIERRRNHDFTSS